VNAGVLDIYRFLPKIDCGQCSSKCCTAFARDVLEDRRMGREGVVQKLSNSVSTGVIRYVPAVPVSGRTSPSQRHRRPFGGDPSRTKKHLIGKFFDFSFFMSCRRFY
jgi:hypothetical protein